MRPRRSRTLPWRAPRNAAVLGASLGLALGAAYLTAGIGHLVASPSQAANLAADTALDPAFATVSGPAIGTAGALGRLDPDTLRMAAKPAGRGKELDCLAEAVYFEARGESPRGQAAVATVIMNRVKKPGFPKTVCGVVYQGAAHRNACQFSFACDGQAEAVVEQSAWERARRVAARALSGAVLRDIGSATHFHTVDVTPGWGASMLRTAQVGLHVFYRLNPHAPHLEVRDPVLEDQPVLVSAPAAPNAAPLRLSAVLTAPAASEPAAAPAAAAAGDSAASAVETAPAPRAEITAPPSRDAAATAS
jgi:hypothetical protein